MSDRAERKPRAKYRERVNAGRVYVAAWFTRGETEALDRLAAKKGTRKAGRSMVLRELVKRALAARDGTGELESEKTEILDNLEKLKGEVRALNADLSEMKNQERNYSSNFPSPEVKGDKLAQVLELFRLKSSSKGEPITLDEVEAVAAKFGIDTAVLEEIVNDLEDGGRIMRGNYGRFSLNE